MWPTRVDRPGRHEGQVNGKLRQGRILRAMPNPQETHQIGELVFNS